MLALWIAFDHSKKVADPRLQNICTKNCCKRNLKDRGSIT